MLRPFLLAPCLLIFLACATPFPIENLEEGMTAETVREKFGEPVATNSVWDPPGGGNYLRGDWTYDAESSWTYVDEEWHWVWSVVYSSVFLPFQIVESAIGAIIYRNDDFRWDWAYVERKPLVLYFEQEKLARWVVIKPTYPESEGDLFSDTDDWDWMDQSKDERHHAKGHKHHHDEC